MPFQVIAPTLQAVCIADRDFFFLPFLQVVGTMDVPSKMYVDLKQPGD